jgi:hypothetical protein
MTNSADSMDRLDEAKAKFAERARMVGAQSIDFLICCG